uniref:Leucine rich repeats and calponin homology domain containing 4 n=1 Tax=Monodelphis domestica TaxID=13616 RepID=A0A5F8HLS7_MONDO
MAAAIVAPPAVGGEETAAAARVPGSTGLPGSRSAERALEEAVATGTLNLSNRRLKQFPRGTASGYDLSDITQAGECTLAPGLGLEGPHLHSHLRPSGLARAVSELPLHKLPPSFRTWPVRVALTLHSTIQPKIIICSPELGDLPLVRLDFSCNHVSRIPSSFRRLRHLQVILLDSNPLQSPPAQICLKGKLHIFKYLSSEAGERGVSGFGDLPPSHPSGFSPCPVEDLFPGRRYDGGLDSGFHSVDSGSKRWSGNELTDEFSELSFRISELTQEPRGPREQREDRNGDGDPEQIDFIDSSVPGEEEDRDAVEEQQPEEHKTSEIVERPPSARLVEPAGEERRRPDTLQLWQDRERRQQQKERYDKQTWVRLVQMGSIGMILDLVFVHVWLICKKSVAFPRKRMKRKIAGALIFMSPQVLESCLQQPLPEDLSDTLANGVILCQLVNHLRPRSVPFIHVPSPAVPKLSALKARKNVESFLEACRKMGVPEESLCQPHHILEEEGTPEKGLPNIITAVHALLEQAGSRGHP